jgi:hypothetical protein
VTAVPRSFAHRASGPDATSGHRNGGLALGAPPGGKGPWTMLLLAFAAALVVVSLGAPREHWRRRG